MLLIISISALARFSSYILSSFSSPLASLYFLGSARCIGARLQRLAALNAAAAALYALRS